MNRGASFVGVRSSAILISVSLCLLLTTCGGGGGGGSQGVIPLKTSVIRTMVPGDSWQYSISVEVGPDQWMDAGSASADILSAYKTSPVTLEACVDQHTVINFNIPGIEPLEMDTHVYFRQDNGSILEYGEGEPTLGDIWVISPTVGYYLELPSPVAVALLPNTTNIVYDDGTTAMYSYQITGTDNVATGTGTFESYEIHYNFDFTESSGAGGSTMATMWYVPGLGMIKEDAYVAWWDGPGMSGYTQIHYRATLRSTTVAY